MSHHLVKLELKLLYITQFKKNIFHCLIIKNVSTIHKFVNNMFLERAFLQNSSSAKDSVNIYIQNGYIMIQ